MDRYSFFDYGAFEDFEEDGRKLFCPPVTDKVLISTTPWNKEPESTDKWERTDVGWVQKEMVKNE